MCAKTTKKYLFCFLLFFCYRSQELDEQFIENIKQKAKELIRKDCQQKRTMVMLLQEDINSVLKQTGNKND